MNDSIELLTQIAGKNQKLIIGLMSGTSLDGLDIALCKISGAGKQTKLELQAFKTASYSEQLIRELKEITSREQVSLQKVCVLHSRLGFYHADLILEALRDWDMEPSEVDCIASHGHSIYHSPASRHQQPSRPNATLQIIDGDHIARGTGILTISDFRQKHTAAGGEGAPMVALVDEMLFADETESRILLNIGGIANFTYLPALNVDGEPITTDTGPGNTLIDHAMHESFNKPYDKDGMIARKGSVNPNLLKVLLNDAFFSRPLPRTTGPELFNLQWVKKRQQEAAIQDLPPENMIATLTWLSAQSIVDTIQKACGVNRPEIYLSGGGMHNAQLIEWIEKLYGQTTHSFAEIGFNPDAKEAACFAVLANEMLSGRSFTINPKNNAGRQVNFGKISLPV
jgi:anhydro-N-acetylmuramic acid kinase